MFVKVDKKNSKTGVKYYASLVENNRIDGKVVQKVLLYFGQVTEDQIPYLKAAYAKKKPRLVYDDGDVVINEDEEKEV
jgi:hypothetical protein